MKSVFKYLLVATFSIFVGSQITEGVILVPYWQSLAANEFYAFYQTFGPAIGRFYTILTIIAAIIPLALAIYFRKTKSKSFTFALISGMLALLFVASFYIYFKGANESFFLASLSEMDLKNELIKWSYWHWGRIVIECGSLVFLMLSLTESKNVLPR